MSRAKQLMVIVVVALLAASGTYAALQTLKRQTSECSIGGSSGGVIQVVAAENFWGSLASQLGGSRLNVTSILSDPNADPHSYESSSANAKAISNACIVIVNGAGYDVWALNLVAAAGVTHQTVLNVQRTLGEPVETNPHFWYDPLFVNMTVRALYDELVKIDPSNAGYYQQQYATLNSSLWTSYMHREAIIKRQFGGVPVASTESAFVYMANATGLDVISPTELMKAVSEGNDPSARDIAIFENQLNGGNGTVHLMVYNVQTVSPLTQSLLILAAKKEIPVVRISETIQPPSYTFQNWMQSEVVQLQNALNETSAK